MNSEKLVTCHYNRQFELIQNCLQFINCRESFLKQPGKVSCSRVQWKGSRTEFSAALGFLAMQGPAEEAQMET